MAERKKANSPIDFNKRVHEQLVPFIKEKGGWDKFLDANGGKQQEKQEREEMILKLMEQSKNTDNGKMSTMMNMLMMMMILMSQSIPTQAMLVYRACGNDEIV